MWGLRGSEGLGFTKALHTSPDSKRCSRSHSLLRLLLQLRNLHREKQSSLVPKRGKRGENLLAGTFSALTTKEEEDSVYSAKDAKQLPIRIESSRHRASQSASEHSSAPQWSPKPARCDPWVQSQE